LWVPPFSAGLVFVIGLLLVRGDAEDPRENFDASTKALRALAPSPVPKEEDAWGDYQQAAAALKPWTGLDDWNPLWSYYCENKYYETAEAQAFWAANRPAIADLLRGVQKERCSFGIDYSTIPWGEPNWFQLREFGNRLAMDARCKALKGEHRAAAQSINAILRLARHAERPPALMASMMSLALEGIAYEAMQGLLSCSPPSRVEDLRAYREALLPQLGPHERMRKSLTVETVHMLWSWDAAQAGALKNASGSTLKQLWDPLCYSADRRCYVAVMEEIASTLSRGERPGNVSALIDRKRTGPVPLTRLITPACHRVFIAYVTTFESGVLTDVALAFLQYRAKHGRDAKSLDELVPEFLAAVPTGADKRQPVRMRTDLLGAKDTNGILFDFFKDKPAVRLYAAGPNGRDDGGLNEGTYQSADDTVILLPVMQTEERP
jgi:hypothetical protein